MILTTHQPARSIATFCGICIVFLLSFAVAHAQAGYTPLTTIPGVTNAGGGLVGYIQALFLLSISVGALLAVIKIAIGGFQYMMTDVVTSKENARRDIFGALIGLGILLASVLVLTTIYPDLVRLDIFTGRTPASTKPEPFNPADVNYGSPGFGFDPTYSSNVERLPGCPDGEVPTVSYPSRDAPIVCRKR